MYVCTNIIVHLPGISFVAFLGTRQIWTNRLLKELDGVDSRLPAGVSLSSHDMEPEAGVCKAYFEASLAAPSKSTGDDNGGGRWGGGIHMYNSRWRRW